MYCQKCGENLVDGAAFCPHCGTKVKSPVVGFISDHDSFLADTDKQPKSEANATPSLQRKSKIFIIAIAAIAVIAVGIKLVPGNIGSIRGGSKYEPCPDLSVEVTKISGRYNSGYVFVKNVGSKTVKNYAIAWVGFDSAGNAVSDHGDLYGTAKFTSANILPGSTYGLEAPNVIDAPDKAKYLCATVSSVEYADGSEWTANDLDSWANKSIENFSVEDYKQSIENLKEAATLAESNPYIEITGLKRRDTKYESDLILEHDIIATQTVEGFEVFLLQYDKNGYSIDVDGYSLTPNLHKLVANNINAIPGTSASVVWDLVIESQCEHCKAIIYSVKLKDGTEWVNENAAQWILYNEEMR